MGWTDLLKDFETLVVPMMILGVSQSLKRLWSFLTRLGRRLIPKRRGRDSAIVVGKIVIRRLVSFVGGGLLD